MHREMIKHFVLKYRLVQREYKRAIIDFFISGFILLLTSFLILIFEFQKYQLLFFIFMIGLLLSSNVMALINMQIKKDKLNLLKFLVKIFCDDIKVKRERWGE